MEPECPLPCSQELITSPYPEPLASSPHLPTYFLQVFNHNRLNTCSLLCSHMLQNNHFKSVLLLNHIFKHSSAQKINLAFKYCSAFLCCFGYEIKMKKHTDICYFFNCCLQVCLCITSDKLNY